MYGEEYPEDIDYGDEMSQDGEEDVSDEDEELGEMGEIEGLPGAPVGVEVIMEDDDDDDDEDDEDMDEDDEGSEDDDDEDDDEIGSEDMDDIEDRIEIVDEEGNPLENDGASGWESETDDDDDGDDDEDDGQDYDDGVQDLGELANMPNPLMQDIMHEELGEGRLLVEEGFDFERFENDGEEDGEFRKIPQSTWIVYDYAITNFPSPLFR